MQLKWGKQASDIDTYSVYALLHPDAHTFVSHKTQLPLIAIHGVSGSLAAGCTLKQGQQEKKMNPWIEKKKKKAVSALLRNKVPKISHLRFGFRDDQLFCAERSVGCVSFVYIYIYISALELTSFVMCVTVTHKHPLHPPQALLNPGGTESHRHLSAMLRVKIK